MKKLNALIPIRGGSKGIPHKNIKIINGKPLFSYVLDAAQDIEFLDYIIVSSEDKKILDEVNYYILREYGEYRNIILDKRLEELARDDSRSIDVAKYIIKKYPSKALILLNACCPLTTRDDITKAIKLFLKTNCDSVVSLVEDFSCHSSKVCLLDDEQRVLANGNFKTGERQRLDKIYKRNTAVYLAKKEVIESETFFGKDTRGYIMPKFRSVDINDMFDFELAEFLLKKQNENTNKG